MIKSVILIISFLAAAVFYPLNAQQETDSTNSNSELSEGQEREYIDSEIGNENNDFDDFGFSIGFGHYAKKTDPTIEVLYGASNTQLKGLGNPFGKTGLCEIRLGQTKYLRYYEHLVKLNHNYVTFSGIASNLVGSNAALSDLTQETWRGGIGHFYGYGYKIGDMSVIPFSSNSLIWTWFSLKNTPLSLSTQDLERLSLFNESLRFGLASEGGIKVIMAPFLTLSAGYERSIILPRYVFLQHLSNMVIEYGGLSIIDEFVRRIIKTSPYAGPVINFILKNGFSYAMYELRKDNMNWPFKSASPITMDAWKAGLTFIF